MQQREREEQERVQQREMYGWSCGAKVIRPKQDHSSGKVDMNSDPRGLRTDGSRGDTKGCGIAQRYYQTSIVAGCDAPVQQKKVRNLEITSPRN